MEIPFDIAIKICSDISNRDDRLNNFEKYVLPHLLTQKSILSPNPLPSSLYQDFFAVLTEETYLTFSEEVTKILNGEEQITLPELQYLDWNVGICAHCSQVGPRTKCKGVHEEDCIHLFTAEVGCKKFFCDDCMDITCINDSDNEAEEVVCHATRCINCR